MSKPAMVHVTYIETTPEKLWHAMTDGAFTTLYWFGRRIEDLPPADQRVGRWALPSGRTIEIFLSAPVDGVRRLRAFYDDASPLDARDQDDLQTRVLEAAANRIQQLTGRRGIGVFLPVPEGTDLEEGRRVRQEGV